MSCQQNAGIRSRKHHQIEPMRLRHLGLLPGASEKSKASAATVRVSTVVVKSGTASLLTVPLRIPIPSAVKAMIP